jgi:hypothetical protein
MLYKVTPMMPEPASKPKIERVPGLPRKRRKTAIYDGDGNEVLITLMCLKCKKMKPLMQFGLRKMADGAIRNQPWCRSCRSGAGTPKSNKAAEAAADVARLETDAVDAEPASPLVEAIAAAVPAPAMDATPASSTPALESAKVEEPAV